MDWGSSFQVGENGWNLLNIRELTLVSLSSDEHGYCVSKEFLFFFLIICRPDIYMKNIFLNEVKHIKLDVPRFLAIILVETPKTGMLYILSKYGKQK